ncbi:MAG: hypothetical protein FGM14_14205 [Flavobacteriales bacterium]|nr:hypothetical protein [Flavobacteriales bacterium]
MTKRLRVFAGPNGPGKSSIIKKILNTDVQKGVKLDFGIYINADDIAKELLKKSCSFPKYQVNFIEDEFHKIVNESGLINEKFSKERFEECIIIENDKLTVKKDISEKIDDKPYERIAQIIADYLRKNFFQKKKSSRLKLSSHMKEKLKL